MKRQPASFAFIVGAVFTLGLIVPAQAIVIYDESIDGDLAFLGPTGTPSLGALNLGSNEIIGVIGPEGSPAFDVFDPFSFTVSSGTQLDAIILTEFTGVSSAFTLFEGLDAIVSGNNVLGGIVVQPSLVGSDLLQRMNNPPLAEGPPLLSGPYSARWFTARDFPQTWHIDIRVTPEPSTMLLLGTGLAGLVVWRWNQSKAGKT